MIEKISRLFLCICFSRNVFIKFYKFFYYYLNPSEKKYSRYKKIVEERLVAVMHNRTPHSLYAPIVYTLAGGGKRLRPVLTILACESVGGKFSSALPAATAIEILHNFTLVHDDIMDNAHMRRGRNSVYKQFDSNTALIAGDTMVALAYEELLRTKTLSPAILLKIFTKGFREVCEGQEWDKQCQEKKSTTLDEYFVMIEKKTAALLATATTMGGIIGNGTAKEISALQQFGTYLGIAFQIQDDYLDIYATETEFGKRIGGDIAEGKKTYPTLRALQKSSGVTKNNLLALLDESQHYRTHEKKFSSCLKKIMAIMNTLHIQEDAHKEIQHWTQRSLRALASLQQTSAKEILSQISVQLVERTF